MAVVANQGWFKLGDVSGDGASVIGEAVMTDGPDGHIFSLLTLPNARGGLAGPVTRAFQPSRSIKFFDAVSVIANQKVGVRAELPRESIGKADNWPLMVRFIDITDPRSVERVDPSEVGVRRIWLETTHDDVTVGIKKSLKWLGDDPLTFGNQGMMGPALAGGYLNNRAFSNGIAK